MIYPCSILPSVHPSHTTIVAAQPASIATISPPPLLRSNCPLTQKLNPAIHIAGAALIVEFQFRAFHIQCPASTGSRSHPSLLTCLHHTSHLHPEYFSPTRPFSSPSAPSRQSHADVVSPACCLYCHTSHPPRSAKRWDWHPPFLPRLRSSKDRDKELFPPPPTPPGVSVSCFTGLNHTNRHHWYRRTESRCAPASSSWPRIAP